MNLRCTHKCLSKSPGLKWVLTLQDSFYTAVSPSHYVFIVPHIVKYRGNKRLSLCKNVLQTTYTVCTAGLNSTLPVKQTGVSEIKPVRPIHHGILFCFVLCTKHLLCRSLHDSSSHSEYSCTVVMAHKPAWICIPQEGMFFIVFCTALLLLIGTSCCPWGNPWAIAHLCEWCQHIFECVAISTLSKQVSKKTPRTILWFVW